VTIKKLREKTVLELRELAKELGIKSPTKYNKEALIQAIEEKNDVEQQKDGANDQEPTPEREKQEVSKAKKQNTYSKEIPNRYAKIKDNIDDTVETEGPLEVLPEGFGLIKKNDNSDPIYVSGSQIQKFRLVTGDIIGGKVREAKPGEKYAALLFLEVVNGESTVDIMKRTKSLMQSADRDTSERYQISHSGILDINPDGFGFLRVNNYTQGDNDIYVAANQIRRYNLRTGDRVTGKIRMSNEGEKFDALLYIEKVNDNIPEKSVNRPKFEELIPIFPNEKINLETKKDTISTRIIDLFAPMGRGQRGMIVASPKVGKTTILKEIALGVTANHPDIELIVLLIDERPEEVTDISRSIDAEIVFSTFDLPPDNHIKVAELVLERGKRLVEEGRNVVILVDSLTRLARANNLVIEPSGRTLSGGIDPEALYFPKKFFGAARNIEKGGSLTIIATALVDTGSRMDDLIFEEFKGTGNMELHLDSNLAERRIYPAINMLKSGTRRDELLFTQAEREVNYRIRKSYTLESSVELMDKMITVFTNSESNSKLIEKILSHK